MTKITLVHDIVEENGKTIKENNLAKQHAIPIGTLVEIVSDDSDCDPEYQHNGLRLFIVQHTRDCDGAPLYSLSINRIAGEQLDQAEKDLREAKNGDITHALAHWAATKLKGSILFNFPEESLKVF